MARVRATTFFSLGPDFDRSREPGMVKPARDGLRILLFRATASEPTTKAVGFAVDGVALVGCGARCSGVIMIAGFDSARTGDELGLSS